MSTSDRLKAKALGMKDKKPSKFNSSYAPEQEEGTVSAEKLKKLQAAAAKL